ncbi:MAG TPA: nuclear transport factor 2 family protein [Candidatus Angelobacter sp.]|nr:nuclear transport factor 2 family protein [Candidatus Angelobacter sp.]
MTGNDPAHIHTLFQEAFNAGDVDSLVALYEPNAVLVVKGQPVTGLPAIRAAYQSILARRSRMSLKTRSVVMFDDTLAVLHGDWTVEAAAVESGTRSGLSTEVVRRQSDGSWRFVIDNPNTPR